MRTCEPSARVTVVQAVRKRDGKTHDNQKHEGSIGVTNDAEQVTPLNVPTGSRQMAECPLVAGRPSPQLAAEFDVKGFHEWSLNVHDRSAERESHHVKGIILTAFDNSA